MNILFCVPTASPAEMNPGGIILWAKHFLAYHDSLSDTDISLKLMPCNRSHLISENTGRLARLYFGIRDYLSIVMQIRKQLRSGHYDAIHQYSTAEWSSLKDYVIFRLAHHYGVKTIIHYHTGKIRFFAKDKDWSWHLLKMVLSVTDKAIVIDPFSLRALESNGYKNVFYVPNPLFPSVEDTIAQNRSLQRVPRRVLFASRAYSRKGIYELTEACKRIPGIDLRIVGHIEKKDEAALRKMTGNAGWLTIVGGVTHEEVIREMLQAEIFVLPSYSEGFPLAVIESMACGTPVISTPVGAIPEMLDIDGEKPCGVCVPVQDTDALQDAIRDLLNNPEKRGCLSGRAMQRIASRYSIENVYHQMSEVWKR